jgi:hypothetical protein
MKITPLLLLAIAMTLNAPGTVLQDKVQAFNDALKAASPAASALYGRTMSIPDPENYPGGDANLEQMVQQIMATNSAAKVQKAGNELLAAIRDEGKARTSALTAKVDAALAKVPDVVAKAQKPADLDTILGQIQAALPTGSPYGYGGGGVDLQDLNNRVNNTYQFVSQWQDYLSQSASGNKQAALNTLRSLSQQRPSGVPIVPRSDILQRIATLEAQTQSTPAPPFGISTSPQPSRLDPIIEKINSLDNLPAAIEAMDDLNLNMMGNEESFKADILRHIADNYARAKNGLPFSLDPKPSNYNSQTIPPQLAPLEGMLYTYLLPRYFGAGTPAINNGESIDDYLDRLTTAAEGAQNLTLLQKVTAAKYQIIGTIDYQQNPQGFFTALNQDAAGQYALAVESYEAALRQPSRFVPADFIGSRLATLKKDHPEEYAVGMDKVLHPPAPVYYQGANPFVQGYPGNPIMGVRTFANPAVTPATPATGQTSATRPVPGVVATPAATSPVAQPPTTGYAPASNPAPASSPAAQPAPPTTGAKPTTD